MFDNFIIIIIIIIIILFYFFFENRAVYETMWKNIVERGRRTLDNTAHFTLTT